MFRRLTERVLEKDPVIARGFYAEELRFAIRKYGPDSKEALAARRDYAVVLYRCGETEESLAELTAVIDRSRATGGDADDAFLRDAETRRVKVQFAMGRFEEMERECRCCRKNTAGYWELIILML